MHSTLKPKPNPDTKHAYAQVHFLLCSEMPRPGLADLVGAWRSGGLLGTGARSLLQNPCMGLMVTLTS